MKSGISPFKLGLFILVSAGIGAVAFIWIGAARLFQSTRSYAAFFAQPVTGLGNGAPVTHLGIQIGNVDSIDLAPGDRLVRVVVKLRSSFRVDPSMAIALVQPGITGSPVLALEETPASERTEVPHPQSNLPVLPTRPGSGGIGAAVATVEKKISSMDVQGLVASWERVARRMDRVAGEIEHAGPGVDASVALLRQDLAQLRQAVLEAQTLTRSLRREPGQLIERPAGADPFSR